MKKNKQTRETKPGHYCGPMPGGTGYSLNEDGSYSMAPCDRATFAGIMDKRAALNALLDSTYRYTERQFGEINNLQNKWFIRIAENVGRPGEASKMRYDSADNRLEFVEPQPTNEPLVQGARLRDAAGKEDVGGASPQAQEPTQ